MAGLASRLAVGRGVCCSCSGLHEREHRGRAARRDRLAKHQLRSDRQPLQPADPDHGEECRHASAGLELSSQARRLYRPDAGRRSDSHRDRQHDVSRLAIRRRHRAGRHDRRGEMEISASQQRAAVEARRGVLAGRRRRSLSRRRSSSDRRRASSTRSRRRTARSTSGLARTASSP